jgi:hypothetical protein
LSGPLDDQALELATDRLVTFDIEGERVTGVVESVTYSADENGRPRFSASGSEALALLGDVLGWPVPGNPLTGQTSEYYTATGAAETVLGGIVSANAVTRLGLDWVVPASLGRGSSVTIKARMTPLLEIIAPTARNAGLGVRLGLVDSSSSMRAELTLQFYEPEDLTGEVVLSPSVGTVGQWSHTEGAPTVTRAIVGGGGEGTARVFRQTTSTTVETAWGRVREVFVDARDTSATAELDQRAAETLAEGVNTAAFELSANDSEGTRYGEHYRLGDRVRAEVLTGTSGTEIVEGVVIEQSTGGPLRIQPIIGNPDRGPWMTMAQIIRGARREIHGLKTRR